MTETRAFTAVTLVEVGEGPEDVVVDEAGRCYTGLADGRVVRIDPGGGVHTVGQCPGRPLGLELLGPDELVVCASDAGLLAMSTTDGTVRVLTDRVAGEPLLACNNAAVAADGTIYFTDSSRRYPIPQWRADIMERTASGRLLRRDPDGTVTELLGGLEFANGVALAADASSVVVAETARCRLHRVWLTGPAAGRAEVFAETDGYPDNASTGSDGLIWVAVASPRVAALAITQRLPAPLRALVRALPARLQPQPARTVAAVAFDADGRAAGGRRGPIDGFVMLTGVREHRGRLYLGTLTGPAVATTDA